MIPRNSVLVLLQSGFRATPAAAPGRRSLFRHTDPVGTRSSSRSPVRIQLQSTLSPATAALARPTVRAEESTHGFRPAVDIRPTSPPPAVDGKASQRTIPRKADPFSNDHLPQLNAAKFRNVSSNALSIYLYQRKIRTKKLSKYLELQIPIDEEGTYNYVQRKANRENRPMALVCPWLMAQPKHVNKYTRLYTDLGMDVLRLRISPLDLLFPVDRAQVAAKQLLEFLLDNPQWNKLHIHGMSVGAYAFMEVMTKMEANESRYLSIRDRFVSQVWDSPCDLPGLKEGVSRSITDSRVLQERIMDGLEWFLHMRYDAATRHYVKTQDMYGKNYCGVPSMFLYSRADPVSIPAISTALANKWHVNGHEVFTKVFNESNHVGHYAKYKAEYTAHIYAFLEHTGMLKHAGITLED